MSNILQPSHYPPKSQPESTNKNHKPITAKKSPQKENGIAERVKMCYTVTDKYDFCGHLGRTYNQPCTNALDCDEWILVDNIVADFCPRCHSSW